MKDSLDLEKQNKRLKLCLWFIFIPLFIALAFIIYLAIYNTMVVSESDLNKESIKILEVKEGDCEDPAYGCVADILVTTETGEYRFNDISIDQSLEVLGPISTDEENPYYLLDLGYTNCHSQYLFNIDSISKRFSQGGEGFLIDNYYFFEGCGMSGYHIELLTDISILDIENNKVISVLNATKYKGDDTEHDVTFTIDEIKDNVLTYHRCEYDGSEYPECALKTYDLNFILTK